MKHPLTWIWSIVLLMAACSGNGSPCSFDTLYYEPSHAGGFEIVGDAGKESRVVRVKAPWQGADSTAMELFIARGGETPPEGWSGQVLHGEARRIIAMSSSYIAMLDLLDALDRLRGVSGMKFISHPVVRANAAVTVDVGHESSPDYEKLVAAGPDLVLLYGINASSSMESRLKSLGISYLYMGEYLESDPLGRAEWMVALAEIIGQREKGEKVFSDIARRYRQLCDRVPEDVERPGVMLNLPYGDVWYMPSATSGMARMIHDAGGRYVCTGNESNRSLPVSLEEAYVLASGADFWLNTGQAASLEEVVGPRPEFRKVPSVTGGKVYNCDRRVNGSGGNDFWESGQVRPDLVLEDLIRMFHPGCLEGEGPLHYYRKLK